MTQYAPITNADILPLEVFTEKRTELRQEIVRLKKNRRVSVGPDITFYFENRATLLWQIQEMLYIEKGGEEQLKDELQAYNTLVPQKNELVATMMIEIEDMDHRRVMLSQLGHIEKHITILFEGEILRALSEDDVERTTAEGKTSAVHFLHFPMTENQAALFLTTQNEVLLAIEHPRYHYQTSIPKETLESLRGDL